MTHSAVDREKSLDNSFKTKQCALYLAE